MKRSDVCDIKDTSLSLGKSLLMWIYFPANASITDDTRIGTHVLYIHESFRTTRVKNRSWWDLLRLERTDHDWQPPWRLHGEALLPVRMTWEQRGRDRSLAVLVSVKLLVPSLAHSPLFSCNFLWQWNGETYLFAEYRIFFFYEIVIKYIFICDLKFSVKIHFDEHLWQERAHLF